MFDESMMILGFERHISTEFDGISWGEIVWCCWAPGDMLGVSNQTDTTQSHM